jgi:glutathione S-transferase
MIFYYAPKTVSMATHITLEEVGADYEARRVDFSVSEQRSAEYLSLNPKGRVPALQTPDGMLNETPAILTYLAQTHPEAGLAPIENAYQFAKLQEFNLYLCATVHVAHAHGPRGSRWADDESSLAAMRAKVSSNMADCFALIESKYFQGPWVMGESFTICDPYLFTVASWLEVDGVDINDFPKINEHSARMKERPAVSKVLSVLSA